MYEYTYSVRWALVVLFKTLVSKNLFKSSPRRIATRLFGEKSRWQTESTIISLGYNHRYKMNVSGQ